MWCSAFFNKLKKAGDSRAKTLFLVIMRDG